MIKLTGLWLNVDRNGDKFMSGNIGQAKIFIYRNKFKKEGSNDPDYNLNVELEVKKEGKPKDDALEF